LPGFDLGNASREARANLDWLSVLRASRADATQYTIWHRTNTEPVLVANPDAIQKFLWIDINALAQIVVDICFALRRLNRSQEIPVVLDRFRNSIKHERWQRKITYFHSVIAHINDDTSTARKEFEKLGEIDRDEKDVEILQLYIDLFGDELSFSRTIEICDQILSLTKKASERFQYNGLKAFAYASIGDDDKTKRILAAAISEGRRRAEERPLSIKAKDFFAGLLSYQGLITRKEAAFSEAVALYDELLSDRDAWEPEGRSMVFQQLGECQRFAGNWAAAEEAYKAAALEHPTEIAKVFLAECLARQGKIDEAVRAFDGIAVEELTPSEAMDHAYIAAMIAVDADDAERIRAAISMLKRSPASAPYFEERRLNLIVQMHEALAKDRPRPLMRALHELFRRPLKVMSKYMIMQPTVFGFGINLNAIIDEAEKDAPAEQDSKQA